MAVTAFVYGQSDYSSITSLDKGNMIFRDTVFNIAVDSLSHNLGKIVPTNDHNRLVKYFKYVGKDSIYISRAWTNDPHYICEYPKDVLIPNQIYTFTVCFWHHNRQGAISKIMGFDLSDKNRITFMFKGTYLPIAKHEYLHDDKSD